MPAPSPFHERTKEACISYRWKEWGGYYAVSSFDLCCEREYFSFRHSCGVTDVTPLFKYDIVGKDSADYLARLMTRDVRKLKPGRVAYGCWCDDEGKVLDDGTVACLEPDRYFLTAADPCYDWLCLQTRGYDVEVVDASEKLGALALQGPTSRDVLKACSDGVDMDKVRFFRVKDAKIDGVEVRISRTGYTGDLGYEIWVPNEHAVRVWDAVMEAGRGFGVLPAGLDALDMARVEAGFIMAGVDYYSARHCMIESRKSTPYELDLGWTVHLDREPFIGQDALKREAEEGSALSFVCLDIDWVQLERLYSRHDLPPSLPSMAWRDNIPVYDEYGEQQIGRATSGAWSPTLKKNLALATVESEYAAEGTRLTIEQTVEYERHKVLATVVKKPVFDPKRKRKP